MNEGKKLSKALISLIAETKKTQEKIIDFAQEKGNPQLAGECHEIFEFLAQLHNICEGFEKYVRLVDKKGVPAFVSAEKLVESINSMDDVETIEEDKKV